jgi:hypothetical protein
LMNFKVTSPFQKYLIDTFVVLGIFILMF